MTRSRILVWLALVALLGGACGSATAQPRGDAAAIAPDLAEEVGDEAVGDLAHGLDTLGWDLLTQLRHGSATTVVSPVSVAAMLSLVLAGAGGETAEELADALGTDPAAPGDGRVGALLLRLTSTDEVELTLANAVWVADAHALTDSYHDDVTRTLGATVDELDLADPAAVAVIDEWVADRTDGLIDRITDALRVPDPNVVAVLANATHFAGSWSDAFDPDDTAPGTFTRDDGSEVQVPLMRHDRTAVDVAVDPGAQLLLARLPYGDSDDDRGDFGFEVLVPTDARPLAEALDAIDAETWRDLSRRAGRELMPVTLPRFRVAAEHDLVPALQALGVVRPFGDDHDFTPMSPSNPWLETVVHKAVIEVEESGTEAAAVTAGEMAVSAPLVEEVVVNRSFAFAVRHLPTGAPLFTGVVDDPR